MKKEILSARVKTSKIYIEYAMVIFEDMYQQICTLEEQINALERKDTDVVVVI